MRERLRALVIDDARHVLVLMQRLLDNFDCEIRTCHDSKQAVSIVKNSGRRLYFSTSKCQASMALRSPKTCMT